MPRSVRIQYPGAHYHAMCRGNNREEIFFRDDGRRLFLHTLTEVCEQTGWLIHAYCLMTNHYHLLLETPEANPPPPRLRRDMSSSAKATAGHVWWKE